jgi:hypothetical protein
MLAFVFWHWPAPGTAPAAYEEALLAFHQELARVRPSGFDRSLGFRVDGAPWVGSEGKGYEDWYLVAGFAALEALNVGAVSGPLLPRHTAIAGQADGGAGGLYALAEGPPEATASEAAWLAKPKSVAYADFYAALAPERERAQASLWRRQLVLGPTPEFCLLSASPLELPAWSNPIHVTRTCLWAGLPLPRQASGIPPGVT